MNTLSPQRPTWMDRVVDLLDDPVGLAILRRDGLNRDDVIRKMEAAARRLHQRTATETRAAA